MAHKTSVMLHAVKCSTYILDIYKKYFILACIVSLAYSCCSASDGTMSLLVASPIAVRCGMTPSPPMSFLVSTTTTFCSNWCGDVRRGRGKWRVGGRRQVRTSFVVKRVILCGKPETYLAALRVSNHRRFAEGKTPSKPVSSHLCRTYLHSLDQTCLVLYCICF